MAFNLEEVYKIEPLEKEEIELEKTNDFEDLLSPNWTNKVKRFNLGLENSKSTVLSNMTADKINKIKSTNDWLLSELIQLISTSHLFVLRLLARLLLKEKVKQNGKE